MMFVIGLGGWVRFTLDDPAGLLVYVRVHPNSKGRFVIREMYVDASEQPRGFALSGPDLEAIPIDRFEAILNASKDRAYVEDSLESLSGGVQLDVLASYFAHHHDTADDGPGRRNVAESWVAAAYAASIPEHPYVKPVPKASIRASAAPRRRPESTYRLKHGPGEDGLTDDFLTRVTRAYASAVARGEAPNRSIADQVGVPLKTAQRWVYTARQRGFMPAGRRGVVG
jgi:hypothetical protein